MFFKRYRSLLVAFVGGAKREFTDVFYLFALQGVNQLIPLVVMPYLIIVLGAKEYGYLGFAQSVIQYFILLVDFGFNLSATQRIAAVLEDRTKISKIFYATLYAKIILLIISILLFFIILCFVDVFHAYQKALIYTFPMVLGNTFTFTWLFQGLGKIRYIAIINTVSKFLILPLTFFLVKTPDDYLIAAFIQSFVFVMVAIISIYCVIRWRLITYVQCSWKNIKPEVRESFPLFLSTASISMYTQLFIVILGFLSTPEVVGRYAAAERIMRALCFVVYVPVNQAFFSRISSLALIDRGEAVKLFGKILRLVGVIMILLWMILFMGNSLLVYFLGPDYSGISELFRIFAFAPFAIGVGGVIGQMGLVALGDFNSKRKFQQAYMITALVSLILVSCLTPLYAAVGAALALVATEYTVLGLMMYYYNKSKICC